MGVEVVMVDVIMLLRRSYYFVGGRVAGEGSRPCLDGLVTGAD